MKLLTQPKKRPRAGKDAEVVDIGDVAAITQGIRGYGGDTAEQSTVERHSAIPDLQWIARVHELETESAKQYVSIRPPKIIQSSA